MVVTSWLPVGNNLVISDDQVESHIWCVAGGSSHTFVTESPDGRARAVIGVTPQSSSLFSLHYSPFNKYLSSSRSVLSQMGSLFVFGE